MRTHPFACFLFVCLAVSTSWAQPLGTAFTYQGRLKNGGSPANGSFNMDFKLYTAPSAGTLLASQTLQGVSVTDGLFTVQVDFGAGGFDGFKRWLEVTVNGSPLLPRQELTAVPNARFALNADRLDGLDSTAFLTGVPNPLSLTGTSNNHIIQGQNLSAVTGASGVYGLATAATGVTYGGRFDSASTSGRGVSGLATAATGINIGVTGESASTSGIAVNGYASAFSGTTYGGFFEAKSSGPNAAGVFGYASALGGGTTYGGSFETRSSGTGAAGVFGLASNSSGDTFGVLGQSNSTSGFGVIGRNDCASGTTYGVFGRSESTSGRGVYGYATAFTGTTYGVWGKSDSTSGRGVYGLAGASSGTTYGGFFETSSSDTDATGVFGHAAASSGTTYGVWGKNNSTSGFGVIGINDRTSGTTYGVYGRTASPSGWAVFAQGHFGASGTKSFRIDHPDDPANKYLLHYAAESPEVINFYRGSVLLDGAGQAVVELPHYFARINTAPSYQLTAIGASMPKLHVADVIDEAALSAGARAEPGEAAPMCSFRIAGGAPGARVSWRVEAVRNDRLVQQHEAPVEVEKQGLEKGTYQHPELYGQPPEKGMNYDATRTHADRERESLPTPAESASSAAPTEAMPH